MSNVLGDDKRNQVVALGRLGWSLRRIEQATGVRRETSSGYLKAAGIVVPGRGRRSEAKSKAAISGKVSSDLVAKPAITTTGVSTDSDVGTTSTPQACPPAQPVREREPLQRVLHARPPGPIGHDGGAGRAHQRARWTASTSRESDRRSGARATRRVTAIVFLPSRFDRVRC